MAERRSPLSASAADEGFANDFLAVYLADVAAGVERSLEAYQALFLGRGEAVAAELGRIRGDAGEASTVADAGGLAIPQVELGPVLGQGGQGVVYTGRQTWLDRRVAVKVLAPGFGGPGFVDRFRREARLLAGLAHPNIVTCHDAGVTEDGTCYLVMELVEGPNLRRWLAQHGPLPPSCAAALGRDLARALGHALRVGIVHRDVKPENVLLMPRADAAPDDPFPFAPKLADLGLARPFERIGRLTVVTPAGAVLGTPSTMAPEQFDSPDTVDARADVYGLGCVLFHALTGRPAFAQSAVTELIVAKTTRPPPDPRARVARVPGELAELVTRMLAPKPDDRPGDLRELAERLDRLAGAPPRRRRRRGAVMALLVVALLAVIVAIATGGGSDGAASRVATLVLAPPSAREGSELVVGVQVADPGRGPPVCEWRQLDGPPVDLGAARGAELRVVVPYGATGATLGFAAHVAVGGEAFERQVNVRIDPDPATAPIPAGERRVLIATGGDDPLPGFARGDARDWLRCDLTGGAMVHRKSGTGEAHRLLPRGAFRLSGSIDPRFVFTREEPQKRLDRGGVRCEFGGGAAFGIELTPVPDDALAYRAALVRLGRRPSAAVWHVVDELAARTGRFSTERPLGFAFEWRAGTLAVSFGEVSDESSDASTRIELGPDALAGAFAPARLTLRVEAGNVCFRDLALVGL